MDDMDLIIGTNARGRQRLLALWRSGVIKTLIGQRVASLVALSPLVQRWRGGDDEAGARLFKYYYDAVQRFFMNKVASGVGALVEWTFQRCRSGTDDVDDEDTLVYLLCIANQVLREAFHELRPGPLDFETITSQQLSPGVGSVAAENQTQRLLFGALRRIPVNDQIIIELHYWHKVTMTELARILSTGHDRINDLLTHAHNRLEHAMYILECHPELLGSTMMRLDDQPGLTPVGDQITRQDGVGPLSAG